MSFSLCSSFFKNIFLLLSTSSSVSSLASLSFLCIMGNHQRFWQRLKIWNLLLAPVFLAPCVSLSSSLLKHCWWDFIWMVILNRGRFRFSRHWRHLVLFQPFGRCWVWQESWRFEGLKTHQVWRWRRAKCQRLVKSTSRFGCSRLGGWCSVTWWCSQ